MDWRKVSLLAGKIDLDELRVQVTDEMQKLRDAEAEQAVKRRERVEEVQRRTEQEAGEGLLRARERLQRAGGGLRKPVAGAPKLDRLVLLRAQRAVAALEAVRAARRDAHLARLRSEGLTFGPDEKK